MSAFTLAEVLITLGIIGVIAALTIPALFEHHQKIVTATKVKKFYSDINNAVRMSSVENGDVNTWLPERHVEEYSYDDNLQYLSTYILPYIKYSKYSNCNGDDVCVALNDGTMFTFKIWSSGADLCYYLSIDIKTTSRTFFAFQFNKGNDASKKVFVEPYITGWDGNYNSLITPAGHYYCHKNGGAYCTKLLQLNNWKITKDYPW